MMESKTPACKVGSTSEFSDKSGVFGAAAPSGSAVLDAEPLDGRSGDPYGASASLPGPIEHTKNSGFDFAKTQAERSHSASVDACEGCPARIPDGCAAGLGPCPEKGGRWTHDAAASVLSALADELAADAREWESDARYAASRPDGLAGVMSPSYVRLAARANLRAGALRAVVRLLCGDPLNEGDAAVSS